jgi:hypothetical protein
MKKLVYYILLFLGSLTSCLAQQENVDLRTGSGKLLRKFEYHQKSNFDVVNGRLNVALVASNGYVFEVNGIPVKNIQCGKTVNIANYSVVLIDNRLDKTFVLNQKSKPNLKIKCLPNGAYELVFTGDLFVGKEKLKVFARLKGSINHSRNLKTN